jgi:hypothetical protein
MNKLEMATQIIKALEWSETRQGAAPRRGSVPGTMYPACPFCGGVMPRRFQSPDGIDPKDVGHSFECLIGRFLTEEEP